jgi:arginine/lysine/ornithine decarboxylase
VKAMITKFLVAVANVSEINQKFAIYRISYFLLLNCTFFGGAYNLLAVGEKSSLSYASV